MNIILFDTDEIDKPLSRKDDRGKHIIRILHKKEGETFEAGIINGACGHATITEITETEIKFNFKAERIPDTLYPLILIIGFPRPIQLKRLLRDVSSLGVCQILLVGTELGEKSYIQSTMMEKGAATKALIDGAMQAKNTFIPELSFYENIQDALKDLKYGINKSCSMPLLLDNVSPTYELGEITRKGRLENRTVIAAIGSERGWSEHEREIFFDAGFLSCGMGNRILRTETAAVTATSLILTSMKKI